MQLALKENKNKELKALFTGPVAIMYSKDEVSAAKIAVNFFKEHDKLIVLGGLIGDKFLEQKDVLKIASLPSLDEIRAKLVTLIQTPAKNIAFALKFAAIKLVRVFDEYSKLEISEKKIEEKSSKNETSSDSKLEETTKGEKDENNKTEVKSEE